MSKHAPRAHSGKPPADVNSLEPLMPDRAGFKTRWFDIVKFIFKIIPYLPRLIASRPSVVDARVHEAGDPLLWELWSSVVHELLVHNSSSRRSNLRKAMRGLAPLG
jgi:hypothetical protein